MKLRGLLELKKKPGPKKSFQQIRFLVSPISSIYAKKRRLLCVLAIITRYGPELKLFVPKLENIRNLSHYRIDGHPSVCGGKDEDCSHWYLSIWSLDVHNQIVYAHLHVGSFNCLTPVSSYVEDGSGQSSWIKLLVLIIKIVDEGAKFESAKLLDRLRN